MQSIMKTNFILQQYGYLLFSDWSWNFLFIYLIW